MDRRRRPCWPEAKTCPVNCSTPFVPLLVFAWPQIYLELSALPVLVACYMCSTRLNVARWGEKLCLGKIDILWIDCSVNPDAAWSHNTRTTKRLHDRRVRFEWKVDRFESITSSLQASNGCVSPCYKCIVVSYALRILLQSSLASKTRFVDDIE